MHTVLLMKSISLAFFVFVSLELSAQDRFVVFFQDKVGSTYSIERPEEFLSTRAIMRRQNQDIPLAEDDLPVNESYVSLVESFGIEVFYSSKWFNAVLVQANDAQIEEIEALSIVSSVEYVAPNAPLTSRINEKAEKAELPSDQNRAFTQQKMLGIDKMHEFDLRGEGMLVAIFDDGFDNYDHLIAFDHLLRENRLLYTFDFVSNSIQVNNNFSHGTRVLSILAAKTEDYEGVIPEASYILSVTEEVATEYRIEEYNWLFAAEKADSAGVDVINTSLGYFDYFDDDSMNYSSSQINGETTVITQAANFAASKGILLVSSAGNSGRFVDAPADSPNVISVGAVNSSGVVATFSSKGLNNEGILKPDVMAQGVGTLLVTRGGSVFAQNGTSFSAPLVTGLATGVWQAYPDKSASEIRQLINASGSSAQDPQEPFGYGIPSFEKIIALENADGDVVESFFRPFPNPTTSAIQLQFDESTFGEKMVVQVINSEGKLVRTSSFVPFGSRNTVSVELNRSGIYLIRVITTSQTLTQRIIKY